MGKFDSFDGLGQLKKELTDSEGIKKYHKLNTQTLEGNIGSDFESPRNPLEKVKWTFLTDNPEELKKVFNIEAQRKSSAHVFYASIEKYPELEGWQLMFAEDYLDNPEGGALIDKHFNDKKGRGAFLVVHSVIKNKGNAEWRHLNVDNKGVAQATLDNDKWKGDKVGSDIPNVRIF